MRLSSFSTARLARMACLGLATMSLGGPHVPVAFAQAIQVSVNGDPITSIDIEQRMKLLRALRKPASRDAAVESMISDRLKSREAQKFGVVIKDNEIGEQVQTVAGKMKISAQQVLADLQKNGVTQAHLVGYFKAELGYSILIKALNRGVEASEIAVRQELAKEKGKNAVTSYTIRQVVFTVNPGEGDGALQAGVKQAEALRSRFSSCATGIPYAKSLPGVAVREKLTRSSLQLQGGIKDVLDKTPIGHLTAPSRSPNGIELIAVCERSATADDTELRKVISDRLLAEHMGQEEAAKYKEMRSRAVISRQ